MKNKHLFIAIFFGSILFFFTNCGDEQVQNVSDLIGTWDYTQVTISACSNSGNNAVLDYSSSNGYCEPAIDTDRCTKTYLEMDAENYSIKSTIDTDGQIETVTEEQGTYTITSGSPYSTVVFCTDLVCRTGTYIINNTTLNIESIDANNGCNTIILAEKR